MRVRITKPNLRETGSEGEASPHATDPFWFYVRLDRDKPPYLGLYHADEVEPLTAGPADPEPEGR